jgi:outer membrane protein assembly factor BamA
MKHFIFCFFILISPFLPCLQAQDTLSKEKIIKGLDFAFLPSFSYNPDRGLQYGALANFYYYGDSTRYPDYLYSLYLLFARTTKREYSYHFFFDSKELISSKIRLLANLSFRKSGSEQFYGFNGYNSNYQHDFEDPANKDFISRHYYDLRKTAYTALIDVQGELPVPHFRFAAGLGYYNITQRPIIREGHVHNPVTLFSKYLDNGAIPTGQYNGGVTTYLKAGLIYDSRDNESIPTRGIWFEAIYCYAPYFLNNKQSYSQGTLIYRQYLPLKPRLVFAYRVAYQSLIMGEMPYYMLPYLLSTYWTDDALGGVKTIRGVHNHRLEGDGYGLANFEFRYSLLNTILFNHNVGIALNAFTDMGIVSRQHKLNPAVNLAAIDYQPGKEKMHYSAGGGIRFILNHNFIVSFDCGAPFSKKDGQTALYIDLDYLF